MGLGPPANSFHSYRSPHAYDSYPFRNLFGIVIFLEGPNALKANQPRSPTQACADPSCLGACSGSMGKLFRAFQENNYPK